ncbi:MAG: MFS transporter [Anaerolineae bacterium]|nr:MFS transporter [Anaerolineae bacterium]
MSTNHILRRLLQLDRPIPNRTEAEIDAEVYRNYRWNFWFNMLDGIAFWIALGFTASTTVLPLLVRKLTDSTLVIGLIQVVAQGGWLLPQLFTANAVQRLPRKKPVVVNLGLFLERLPYWAMTGAILLAPAHPTLSLIILFIAYSWHVLGAGAVATAWQDMIANIFPVERRGRFFGLTSALGTAMGALSAIISERLLKTQPFPFNFFYNYLLAAIFVMVSWGFLAFTREPVRPVTGERQSTREFWSRLPEIMREDHNFRRFLIARIATSLGGMGIGFLAVAALDRWAVPDHTVALYTFVTMAGQATGNLVFGFLADRFGHIRNLVWGTLVGCLGFILAWLAPSPAWFLPVFFIVGIACGAGFVSGLMVVPEFCTAERRPTYIGLANTGAGLASTVAPLLGTALLSIGYDALFIGSALFNLLGVILMRWWVREPRHV